MLHVKQESPGLVSLVGCGPGDPELLTLKAVRRIREADVLVTDRLVAPPIIALGRAGVRIVEVGKQAGGPSVTQSKINRILVREALLGHRVARLKGGDSFVFGRAAEEMAAVRAAGIAVEVLPGITAAHACAASIGLPLTLREQVRQFSILTGATADGRIDLDWISLARPGQAFAIYMGLGAAAHIRERLLDAGADPGTRVIVVENGTLPQERVISTRLEWLVSAIRDEGIAGPAIIFVGLSWEAASLSRPPNVKEHIGASRSVPASAALDEAGAQLRRPA